MDRRPLGRDGALEVSRLSLGSWRTFERIPREDALAVMHAALDVGINFLDDARYNDETGAAPIPTGYSEVLFGELFRAAGWNRADTVVSNKLWWEFWPEQDAVSELEGSLERMGFDRLDLLYSSTLPDTVPVAVAVEQIAAVLATGRVRAWSVVNWSAETIAQAATEANRQGVPQPCAAQLPYSLARLNWVEDPGMDAALEATGASLVPSASLAGGALTGKYAEGGSGRLSAEPAGERRVRELAIGAALRKPARRLQTTPATLAIAFTLVHPRSASTLIGATSPAQIDDALAAVELAGRLGPEDERALRALADRAL